MVAVIWIISQPCCFVSGQERSLAQVEKSGEKLKEWFEKEDTTLDRAPKASMGY